MPELTLPTFQATCTSFLEVKNNILRVQQKNTNYDNDGCNDNYDGNCDDNDDKNDQMTYKYQGFKVNIYQS